MTNLRERAREIKAAGEAERGNFEPTGAPLRLYNYWLTHSEGSQAALIREGYRRENFCHFWRVVAIWAPLLFVFLTVDRFVTSKAGAIITAGAVLALLVWSCVAYGSVLYVVLIGLAGCAAVAVGAAAGYGVYRLFKRYWNHDWEDILLKVLIGVWVAVVSTNVAFALYLGFKANGWMFGVWLVAGLASIALIIFVGAKVAEFISGKRALAKKAEDEKFEKMTWEEIDAYLASKRKVRTPGRISKFFSGIADFLILATQIVRVKKWKICPMVDLNS